MSESALRRSLALHRSDIRGLSRLTIDAVVGVTDLVEAMHETIGTVPGVARRAPSGRTTGVTGFVYGSVRGTTRLVGKGLDAVLGFRAAAVDNARATPRRDALIAALNGVFGDHLADTANPLAIPMTLRVAGRALVLERDALAAAAPGAGRRLIVLVHGLCMNDRQWRRNGHDHGLALGKSGAFVPLYLHYNSGRHVSQNGRALAALLERLVASWPVPVEELVLVGHSMGGLVIRSACHLAREAGDRWLRSVSKAVFLGTPHHGATLERGGHRVDMLFGVNRYAVPLARISKLRSAGITDLRFGNVQDADWMGRDRAEQRRDDRIPTPLPEGLPCYFVAGCTAKRVDGVRARILGDGLVPVPSALGEHADPARSLDVPASHRRIIAGASHWDLLDSAEVLALLERWVAR